MYVCNKRLCGYLYSYIVTVDIVCQALAAPAHGSSNVSTATVRVGESQSFFCNVGYILTGAKARTCLESGNFTETTIPLCQGMYDNLDFNF